MRILLRLLFATVFVAVGCTSSSQVGRTIHGKLRVPENRNSNDSREISISYARIKSKTRSEKPPIVFVQGGPGGSSLVMTSFFEESPLREERDVILFDARGTGKSEAYCERAGSQFLQLMAQNLTVEEEYAGTLKICAECKEELAANEVDLAGYNSLENAADLEALRKHLNIEKWILFGGSYGTRLGLTYLRDYEAAEAAVFMGLFPLEANIYDELLGGFDASLNYLFDTCRDDPKCNSKYPNLKESFSQLMAELRQYPKTITYRGDEVVLNAQDVLLLIHQMLYERETIQQVPAFIKSLGGDPSRVVTRAMDRTAYTMSFINSATYWSVQATEELQFNADDAINATMSAYEHLSPAPSFFATDQQVLAQWHPHRSEPKENQRVVTNTPILIVGGLFDPITPIANARAAADYLPNATLVEFSNDGHTIFNDCFFDLMLSFLSDGYEVTNTSCSERSSLRWK